MVTGTNAFLFIFGMCVFTIIAFLASLYLTFNTKPTPKYNWRYKNLGVGELTKEEVALAMHIVLKGYALINPREKRPFTKKYDIYIYEMYKQDELFCNTIQKLSNMLKKFEED